MDINKDLQKQMLDANMAVDDHFNKLITNLEMGRDQVKNFNLDKLENAKLIFSKEKGDIEEMCETVKDMTT